MQTESSTKPSLLSGVRWWHWLVVACVCGTVWWLALTYYQREMLVITGASAAYTAAALLFFRPALKYWSGLVVSAIPFVISLGAATVAAAWLLALIV